MTVWRQKPALAIRWGNDLTPVHSGPVPSNVGLSFEYEQHAAPPFRSPASPTPIPRRPKEDTTKTQLSRRAQDLHPEFGLLPPKTKQPTRPTMDNQSLQASAATAPVHLPVATRTPTPFHREVHEDIAHTMWYVPAFFHPHHGQAADAYLFGNQTEDVSVKEFTEALVEIRGREREVREREREVRESKKRAEEEERKTRADADAFERARCELEKREYKRLIQWLDYEFEQLQLAEKTRELECLRPATSGVEGVAGKACQGKEKVRAGDTEMTENQRLSPDTTVTVLRKTDSKSEWRDGESDVEAATEVVCQVKRKTEAGDTEVTGNQRISSDATDAVSRRTDAVPHNTYPTAELREAESDQDHGKEEKALWASSGGFPDDKGDAKAETTPGKSSQLMESRAQMPYKAVQQPSQG
ncbi:hypothetical protein HPB47_003914 [Ixodes persulcatus]|uniref:Uncharacterized protein n=1 Tax=Ixodes persulcatus TaxID=34615 RepID=A0AC60PH57_IXOPE|nr:hypothetical protein HPB47_003914 [Ixodes persulcatus]